MEPSTTSSQPADFVRETCDEKSLAHRQGCQRALALGRDVAIAAADERATDQAHPAAVCSIGVGPRHELGACVHEVDIRVPTLGDLVLVGVFRRVCEDVVEAPMHVLPQSTRFPPLDAAAEVSVEGDFDSSTGEARFEFSLRLQDDRLWVWPVTLQDSLVPWFALPGA